MTLLSRLVSSAVWAVLAFGIGAASAQAQVQERGGDSRPNLSLVVHLSADRRIVVPTVDQGVISFEIYNAYPRPMLVQLGVDGAPPLAGGGAAPAGGRVARGKSTQVVVESGQTVILGGVTDGKSVTVEAVPSLAKIPYVSRLFRNREERSENSIMLIVTPEIVN